MRKMVVLLLILSLAVIIYAETEEKIYIPKNLDECYAELQKILSTEQLEEFRVIKETDIGKYHFGLGRFIRNRWQL